ncbi:MAG: sodium:proton antiporter [Armatimonadaceae bacterium]
MEDSHGITGIATQLVGIGFLGITAQWLAWRLRVPSILLLLIFGFLAGPITGFLHPNDIFGGLLSPIVSLSVGLILYEGGLTLRFHELKEAGVVLRNLVTVGALVTWAASFFAARTLLGFSVELSALLSAVLVVTGPTVIGPLLRFVRPVGSVSSILKWEGIVIDPIGAMLAALVLEVLLTRQIETVPLMIAWGVFKTVFIGVAVGVAGATALFLLLWRRLLPDFLQNPMSLTLAVTAFAVSNAIQEESGLFSVTVMGMALANQRVIPIRHIIEFSETLRTLLISGLFIILSALLEIPTVLAVGPQSLLFLAALILVVRPLAVAVSTIGSKLSVQQRAFLAWMAPRGIVAAAVSSAFALRLVEAGYEDARLIIPVTFVIIIGTVAVYGLTAVPVGRWLGVVNESPQGVLLAGAHPWARAIARELRKHKLRVVLVDTNPDNVATARTADFPAYQGSILEEDLPDKIELNGVGRFLALTSNSEVNSLAALHFQETFGRSEVYQLPPSSALDSSRDQIPMHLRGQMLFSSDLTYARFTERFNSGETIASVLLPSDFKESDLASICGPGSTPLFVVAPTGELTVYTPQQPPVLEPGNAIICLGSTIPVQHILDESDLPLRKKGMAAPPPQPAETKDPVAPGG